MIYALRYLLRKGRGKEEIRKKAYSLCLDFLSILQLRLALPRHFVEIQSYLNKMNKPFRKTLGYFRNNRSRMNYYRLTMDGYPIGSGEAEAANKVLVTQRLKRSGQSWSQDSGQGVLAFRALLKSDRFDRAWEMVVPRMARSKKTGPPDKTAANDNWEFRIAA